MLRPIPRSKRPGQGLVEYALIIMFVAMVVMVSLGLMGVTLRSTYYDTIAGMFP